VKKKKTLIFEHVTKVVVSVVNSNRYHRLSHRRFQSILSEIDAGYGKSCTVQKSVGWVVGKC